MSQDAQAKEWLGHHIVSVRFSFGIYNKTATKWNNFYTYQTRSTKIFHFASRVYLISYLFFYIVFSIFSFWSLDAGRTPVLARSAFWESQQWRYNLSMVIEKFELSSINGGYRISALLGPCHQLFFHLLLFFFSFFCSIYYFIILHISHNLSFAPVWRKRFLCAIRASKYILTNRESLFLFFLLFCLYLLILLRLLLHFLSFLDRRSTRTRLSQWVTHARAHARNHTLHHTCFDYTKNTHLYAARARLFLLFFLSRKIGM